MAALGLDGLAGSRIPILRISISVSGILQSLFCIHCASARRPAATLDRRRPAVFKGPPIAETAHVTYIDGKLHNEIRK